MSQPETKRTFSASLAVDAALVLAFFTFMFLVLRPHVQSHNPFYIAVWAGLTSACMSSVFWLATQMFRVVLKAQRSNRK